MIEIAQNEEVKLSSKIVIKAKDISIRLCTFTAVTVLALATLIIIDRVLLVVLGLEESGLMLSPIFIFIGGLAIRSAFRKIVRRKEIQTRVKITAAVLLVLMIINLTASFLSDRKQSDPITFTPFMIAQSAAYSLPEILIASVPYIGLPLSVASQVQGVAEERALSRGEDPRDISGEDLLDALFIPPW
ncbi:hypothetical protein [Micavibrio aeruginosavorus]|uniref:hypothetical protein n=1 Tax=Micavibrio aeruginosavorus TaxID=349221 RepID=UPI00059F26E5|nr:hypothetical protein [Micavibrio aeruginosavorus]